MVVGPSGAGKDSILRYAQARFMGDARFIFPRRVITRKADTVAEDHDSLDAGSFDALSRQGAFALQWEAHGLKYGVRRDIDDQLRRGNIVIINVSRTIVPDTVRRYSGVVIAEISAAPEILLARITARGRETLSDTDARIQRSLPPLPAMPCTYRICNEGDLEDAGQAFCHLLECAMAGCETLPLSDMPAC